MELKYQNLTFNTGLKLEIEFLHHNFPESREACCFVCD